MRKRHKRFSRSSPTLTTSLKPKATGRDSIHALTRRVRANLSYLLRNLQARQPASLEVCALLTNDASFEYALKECIEDLKPILSAVRSKLGRGGGSNVQRVRDVQNVLSQSP